MLINEAGVVRAIKRAYKGGGYTVNSQGGVMAIYTQSWYIQARREVMPRKVLATIVEYECLYREVSRLYLDGREELDKYIHEDFS